MRFSCILASAFMASAVAPNHAYSQFMDGFSDSFNRSFERSQQRRHERKLQEQRLQHEMELERMRTQQNPSTADPLIRGMTTREGENMFRFIENNVYVVTQQCQHKNYAADAILDTRAQVIIFLGPTPVECQVVRVLQ